MYFNLRWEAGLCLALLYYVAINPTSALAQNLRWATAGDIQTLDPHAQNEGLTNSFNAHIYERLTARDAKLNLVPGLAMSWKQLNPRRWRFVLRQGVRFHDGTALTAEDVIFSINRAKMPGSAIAQYAKALGEVRALGPFALEFSQEKPNPVLLDQLDAVFIMSKSWAVQQGLSQPMLRQGNLESVATQQANGTGPYRLVSRQPDVRNTLTRNATYWGVVTGNVKTVIHTPIASGATRIAALRLGEVDLVQDVPPQDAAALARSPNLKLWQGPENRVIFLGFDQAAMIDSATRLPNPWRHLQVRQAVAHAIDTQTLLTQLLPGMALPAACLMPAEQACQGQALKSATYPFDLAKARALLDEAGYAKGFDMTLDCPNNRYIQDAAVCTAIAGMLAKVNIRVRVQAVPKAQFFKKLDQLESRFYLLGWGGAETDAQPTLDTLMHSYVAETGQGSDNYGRFSNPTLDALIEKTAQTHASEQRHKWIKDALKIHAAQIHHLVLYRQNLLWASRSNVQTVLGGNNHFRAWLTRIGPVN